VNIGSDEPVIVRREGKTRHGTGASVGISPIDAHIHRFDQDGKPMGEAG